MSPATYHGGACHLTPSQRMMKLDEEGAAYWLENVELVNGRHVARADVVDHNEQWLTLREETRHGAHDAAALVWTVATAHVVCFRLMEG